MYYEGVYKIFLKKLIFKAPVIFENKNFTVCATRASARAAEIAEFLELSS